MKILLVGGNSSLGQVLQPLLATFADVYTAGRAGCDVDLDMTWPVERFILPSGLDTVVFLAAHFGGNDFDAIQAAYETNVLGALKLAQACHVAGSSHFVQVSSIFVSLGEDSSFYNSYALSKRHAEELNRLFCRSVGLPLAIVRPSQIYGEGEAFRRHQPLVFSLLDQAEREDDIVIYGRNDAKRNFIHADDVAEVLARVVRGRVQGCFDCAGLANLSISEIAEAAIAAFGSSSTVRFDAEKPDIPDNAFIADQALYKLIDYFPGVSLERGFANEAARRRALS
jgi:nucleoside-diphosphate-sugar epimerase